MNDNRRQIFSWQQQGLIKNSDINKALSLSESNHTPINWLNFLSKLLLWLSLLSIAFGCIFFFAYNWGALSTFQKFAIIQGLIIISVTFYTQTEVYSTANTAILFFIALLIGSLFALFGQTYQTGKDPWQLFFIWAISIIPLAFTSKSSSLWLLWLFLANLALQLFLHTRHSFFGMIFQDERNMLAFAFLNLLAAVIFEFLSHKKQIVNRIASQVATIAAMVAFTWVAIYTIFELFHSSKHSYDLFIYVAWMAAIYFYYRVKTLDVLILSSWVFSGIICILAFVGRTMGDSFEEGTLLLIGILIIGFSTIGVKWLMALLKDDQNQIKTLENNGEQS